MMIIMKGIYTVHSMPALSTVLIGKISGDFSSF